MKYDFYVSLPMEFKRYICMALVSLCLFLHPFIIPLGLCLNMIDALYAGLIDRIIYKACISTTAKLAFEMVNVFHLTNESPSTQLKILSSWQIAKYTTHFHQTMLWVFDYCYYSDEQECYLCHLSIIVRNKFKRWNRFHHTKIWINFASNKIL